MQAKAVAEGVDQAVDGELGAGVLAADAGHAFGRCKGVSKSTTKSSTSIH